MSFNVILDSEQARVLKLCKKKRRLTCRDVPWEILTELVHNGTLDRVISDDGKNAGWSYYKVSKRGKRYLEQAVRHQEEKRNRA